jgi:hypothetical protein
MRWSFFVGTGLRARIHAAGVTFVHLFAVHQNVELILNSITNVLITLSRCVKKLVMREFKCARKRFWIYCPGLTGLAQREGDFCAKTWSWTSLLTTLTVGASGTSFLHEFIFTTAPHLERLEQFDWSAYILTRIFEFHRTWIISYFFDFIYKIVKYIHQTYR